MKIFDLEIDRKGYKAERTDIAVIVTSDAGNVYHVHDRDGATTCSYPDFKYRQAENPNSPGCKHIQALRTQRILPPI